MKLFYLFILTTLQESNTSHFVVVHATDNKPFTPIGTIAARGNSNVVLSYSYTHSSPERNTHNYYRLQQVDIDERHSYSGIRMVQLGDEKANAFLLYPNPAYNILQAIIYDNDIRMTINSTNGKEVQRLQLTNGINKINLEHLSAGLYYVTMYKMQKRLGTQMLIKM